MQIETAPRFPNSSFATSSKTTSTYEHRETLQEQAKSKATPPTKTTFQRNPATKNNDKANTQVNRLPKGSKYLIKLHNEFGSLDTVDVDLDPSFDKRSKRKKLELHTSLLS